jgi:glucose-1-phosphate thymidylyltransferase
VDIILPVAGLGSRLRPQTWSVPKPLVALAGKPMLAHVIDRVRPLNPDRIVFITGYLGSQIEKWAEEELDIPSAFVVQPEMRGQTDAIVRTREIVHRDALVLFPDALFETDFADVKNCTADVVMLTKEIEDPSSLGVAVVEDGKIVKLVEKPKDLISKLAVIGIYYFKHMPDLFDAIDEQMAKGLSLKNEYYIADAIQLMIGHGKTVVPSMVEFWEDCGNVEALLNTNRLILGRNPSGARLSGSSVIIEPSIVAEGAVIERSIVGPHASVSTGAVITDSIVSDSIVDEGARLDRVNVDHSIIGRSAAVVGRASRLNVGETSVVNQ